MGWLLALGISIASAGVQGVTQWPGYKHINVYPVASTPILIPENTFEKILAKAPVKNPFDQFFKWLGLSQYPDFFERDADTPASFRMGLGRMRRYGENGITVSCAACHVSTLFGKPVIGLTNRFPRANELFHYAESVMKVSNTTLYDFIFNPSAGDLQMMKDLKKGVSRIGTKKPQALGLDTSLAQVALSLSKRNSDEWATFNTELEKSPRWNILEHQVADSKPAVWWNVKYKTRYLSDGSLVQGDPIFTNFLWNEIGRGADLREFSQWYASNGSTIQELKEAVFNTKAPKWGDFFSKGSIDVKRAQRGSELFHQSCAKCHGRYEKDWNTLETVGVNYPRPTKVIDVKTDPGRRLGMKELERLNDLTISKQFGTVVKAQKGYVPPPLVGIFARYPYFHNNSAPTLCAVLTRSQERPKTYFAREQKDPERDFDSECVGYPKTRIGRPDYFYDTSREGMSNQGHDEGIFLKNGVEKFTSEQKFEIIEFLKTL